MIDKIFTVIKFLPSIVSLIVEIEKAVGPGNGAAKKAIVMDAVTPLATPQQQSLLSHVVDTTVASLHAAGVLHPSDPNDNRADKDVRSTDSYGQVECATAKEDTRTKSSKK